MASQWLDEMDDTEPDRKLEPFFILAALELGDPDAPGWLMNTGLRFYDFYRKYCEASAQTLGFPQCNKALVQYLVWYERERPKNSQS